MKRIVEWFKSLPRAARWGIAAAAVFGLYFLGVEPILERTNRYASSADGIESNLRRATDLAGEDSEDGRVLVAGMKAYGRPHLPGAAASRPEAIQRAVDEVLEQRGVTSRTKTERTATLTGDKARAIAGEGKIERYIVEVSFEADQTIVAQVIADLERSPVVSAVSRIKIDRTAIGSRFAEDEAKNGIGKVRATINAESWVLLRQRAESDFSGESS